MPDPIKSSIESELNIKIVPDVTPDHFWIAGSTSGALVWGGIFNRADLEALRAAIDAVLSR